VSAKKHPEREMASSRLALSQNIKDSSFRTSSSNAGEQKTDRGNWLKFSRVSRQPLMLTSPKPQAVSDQVP
jgi:hypothetical protein